MVIVKNLDEFRDIISRPNPNQIYGFIPFEYAVSKNALEKINRIFEINKNCLVYTDILEEYHGYTVPRYNPSFDTDIINRGFKLNSPIFVKTDNPLVFDRTDINEIILQLLQQVIGIHIPEFLFIWKGPHTETNIQS